MSVGKNLNEIWYARDLTLVEYKVCVRYHFGHFLALDRWKKCVEQN